MEGLTDFYMRHILTQYGHYDACVTEFIRVTHQLLPDHVFLQSCPELNYGGKTQAGTPVHVQLLGCDAALLADNAVQAVRLGAPHIDLNFGCPAKTVNRHRGGAILLDEPELIHHIVATVRRWVPAHIPVSAKMRLGVNDHSKMLENAQAIESAGAAELVVHARTKAQGYKPPAHWHLLADICAAIKIPVFANGDIDSPEAAQNCLQESQCQHLMIGRAAVIQPNLVNQIQRQEKSLSWQEVVQAQLEFVAVLQQAVVNTNPSVLNLGSPWSEKGAVGRYKQWLGMLSLYWPQAAILFSQVRRSLTLLEIKQALELSAR